MDGGAISLCAVAQYYQHYEPSDVPYHGDSVGFNISTIASTREGIEYGCITASVTDPSYDWIWDGGAADPRFPFPRYYQTDFADGGIWVDLPVDFSFIFYGVKYLNWSGVQYASHLWICKNGFVCLDDSNSSSTGPAAFPSTAPPNAVIAPFWTSLDFVAGQSEVDTWVSRRSGEGYWFVVEWVNMRETGTSNLCTFGLSLRIYSRTTDVFDSFPPRDHLPSGSIHFFYNSLPAPTNNFTYGLEDQTGRRTCPYGGIVLGACAAQLNGIAMEYRDLFVPYIKYVVLTFQDSNSNARYDIMESTVHGSSLYFHSTPAPQPDTGERFIGSVVGALDYMAIGGDVVVTAAELLGEGTAVAGLSSVLGPVGVVLFAAEKLYDWYTSHQYDSVQAQYQYNKVFDPNTPDPLAGGYAYVKSPAFDNFTLTNDNVFDACLESEFVWVCYNDYHSNHNLTITATAECGYWDAQSSDYNVSTSVSLSLFPDNNNDTAHAQPVTYGFYGDNPLLYIGESPDSYDQDDYYNITVDQNFGTRVQVQPPFGLDLNLSVTDPCGNLICSSDVGKTGIQEEVDFVPSCPSTYTIHVQGCTGGGFYNMTIGKAAVLSVSVGSYPPGAGNVYPRGVKWCDVGQHVSVIESPTNSSYYFIGWSVDGSTVPNPTYPYVSYNTPYVSVTMDQNHALVAYFAQNSSGGDSCPYVSTWNGSGYVLDNNLLPASEYSGTVDVTDYYLLQQTLAQKGDGTCSLSLGELEGEHDYFDSVKLVAVDHASNVNVAVSPTGQILTYANPRPPVSAITDDGENVKSLLDSMDGNYYQGYNGSYVTLNFGRLDVRRGAKLVIRSDMIIIKCPVYVQVMNRMGQWQTVATIYVRRNWTTDIVDMSRFLPDAGGNLKVRLLFTSNDKVDFAGLDTSPQAQVQVQQAQLVSAIHTAEAPPLSFSADVTAQLLCNDQTYAELLPGQEIDLTFTLPTQTMETRSYIIMSEGHYCIMTP